MRSSTDCPHSTQYLIVMLDLYLIIQKWVKTQNFSSKTGDDLVISLNLFHHIDILYEVDISLWYIHWLFFMLDNIFVILILNHCIIFSGLEHEK